MLTSLYLDYLAYEDFSFLFFKLYANNMFRHIKQLLFHPQTFLDVTLVQFHQEKTAATTAMNTPLTKINVS